ncbi:MAG: hypothetical protein WDN06_21545 [Asticcacaulis sp.]
MLLIQAALDKEDLAEVTTRLKGLTRSERTGTRKLGDPYQNDSKTRAVMGWIRTQIARHPLVSAYAQPLRWSQPPAGAAYDRGCLRPADSRRRDEGRGRRRHAQRPGLHAVPQCEVGL